MASTLANFKELRHVAKTHHSAIIQRDLAENEKSYHVHIKDRVKVPL